MATSDRAVDSSSRGVAAVLGRTLLVTAITVVETAALGVWLLHVQSSPTPSLATGVGFAVLAVGLAVKFGITAVAVQGLAASVPASRVTAVVATETGLWALWLLVVTEVGGLTGIAAAGALFALLLVSQHTVEDNVLRGQRLLANVFDLNALGFSIAQAGGATTWLLCTLRGDLVTPLLVDADALAGSRTPFDLAAIDPGLVGLAALVAALFVEHLVGVSFSRHG